MEEDEMVKEFIWEISGETGIPPDIVWLIICRYMEFCKEIWQSQVQSWN